VELFDRDLAKQIKEWRKSGERIVLVMDVNDHPLTSKFYQQLQKEQTGLEEFTHKCWGPIPPYTHISGSSPIDGGYKSSEIEIVNLGMLTFAESGESRRSQIIHHRHFNLITPGRIQVQDLSAGQQATSNITTTVSRQIQQDSEGTIRDPPYRQKTGCS